MDLGLAGKVVLVTGGSKGIGAGIVRAFFGEGANVACVNRPGPEGPTLAEACTADGRECVFIPADLCDSESCRRAVAETVAKFGRLDVVVNNAGVNDSVGLEAGPDEFLASLNRNLVHVYAIVHFALDELKRSHGTIINIGSKVSVTGQGGTSGYAAAKGGLNGLTREWAVDLARHNVRVNAVIPAEVWTPLYDKWLWTLPDPAEARSRIEQMIPLGRRFTTVEEIAATVVFLASTRSSHTTGQIIFVDGGYTHFDRKYTAP